MLLARLALPLFLLTSFALHAEPTEEEFLKQSVAYFEQVSRGLPQQIDEVTRLDKVQLDPVKKLLAYHYTVSNMNPDQLDKEALDKFSSDLRKKREADLCRQKPLLESLKSHQLSINHTYSSQEGKLLSNIEIDTASLSCP